MYVHRLIDIYDETVDVVLIVVVFFLLNLAYTVAVWSITIM